MRFTRFFTIILLLLTGMTSSAQTWTNVTDLYIKNANFMQGDKFWEGTNFGKVSYAYNDAEFWSMNYVKYQEINGIPPGRYRVTLKGFYRIGDWTNDYSIYSSGDYSDYQNATFYCKTSLKDYSVKIVFLI